MQTGVATSPPHSDPGSLSPRSPKATHVENMHMTLGKVKKRSHMGSMPHDAGFPRHAGIPIRTQIHGELEGVASDLEPNAL
eukprot:9134612-Pyramimonas_sp.AAC.1